jgi:hypothetical protein
MTTVDKKAKLTGARPLPKMVKVRVESLDMDVMVRPLMRDEILVLRGMHGNAAKFEQQMLAYAMVDPVMSKEDVRNWQKVSEALEIEDVSDKIMEISGLKDRAEKNAYKSAGDESGS